MKRILFYYPSKTVGGAQTLFIRLANYFSEQENYDVYIVDYDDGYLRKNIINSVNVIEYEERKTVGLDNVIVISPLSMILSIHKYLPLITGKFLFWGIHPENLIDILRGSYRLKRKFSNVDNVLKCINIVQYFKIKKELTKLLNCREVFFMDRDNMERSLSFYHLEEYNDKNFVPIPIMENNLEVSYLNKKNMAWVGRICHDKVQSLLYSLKKINSITKEKVNFYIIGDGDYIDLVKQENYENINIIQKGFISNSALAPFLLEKHVGLVFAMGTSILETSYLKIPSMLVDPSYLKINDSYTPKWAYEIKDYTLGSLNPDKKMGSFESMYQEYLKDSKNLIGSECYNYVVNKHKLEKTALLLEQYFYD